ncbi:MAG: tetratricopeptide repeat protein [Planctomycetota bacterium]
MRIACGLLCLFFASSRAACQTPSPPSPSPALPAPPLPAPVSPSAQEPAATESESTLRERAFSAENRGRYSDAADAFLALAKGTPQRADWVVAAGRCLGRSGRFKEAVDLLDSAKKTFPGALEVRAMLARTFLLQAETDRGVLMPEILWADAAELAEGVLQRQPDDEDCRLILAQARYLLGDRQEAIRQAEEAVRRHPERSGAHVLIGRIATDRFRDLLRQHGEHNLSGQAEADLVGAIDAERLLAKRSFQRAAELDPGRAHPHVALGQLAFLDRHTAEGRAHFLDALAIDPDVALDHGAFATELDWQGRRDAYAEAVRRYEAGTTAKPEKVATLRFYEGRAWFDGAAWADARRCFEQVVAANANAPNALFYLFLSAYRLGDYDTAERHAATYARLSAPAFADVLRGLSSEHRSEDAAILAFLGDRAFGKARIEASRDLNHVIACLVDSADAWNNHAFLCRETQRFDDAWSSYQNALEKEPDSPQLLNDAAVVLQYHLPSPANLEKARTMYERVLQLADKVLGDSSSDALARERASKAKTDAKANLAALPR